MMTAQQQIKCRTVVQNSLSSSLLPNSLARIVVIATGGTIAGAAADATLTAHYHAGSIDISQLLCVLPELDAIARVKAEQMAQIDSKDMDLALWSRLTERIQTLVERNDV